MLDSVLCSELHVLLQDYFVIAAADDILIFLFVFFRENKA